MNSNRFQVRPTQVALAVALCALQLGTAQAQTAPAPADAPLNLDAVVVTASPVARSKMRSSDSVSSVGEEAIIRGGATNAAEILRSVPGVRAESSGGEGNANVTVRGAPISAGGSRYIQFQEDGLPILLFGDIAFGTADQFLRTDYTTDRVEVVRGGSASTMVSNAPGGVVNFVSKTGKDSGNALGVTLGLGSRLNRYDFNLSTPVGKDAYFNVGGFVRQGEGGARQTDFTSENGGQIKATFSKDLGGGNYVKVNLKHLDDKTPSFMPVPVKVVGGQIQTIAGVDPRSAFFINPSLTRDVTINASGNRVTSNPQDGLQVRSDAIGVEARFNLGSGWVLEERFRKASNSGRFIANFPADNGLNGTAASFTATMFNTSLDNMDNLFNDLKVSRSFDTGGGKAVLTGGVFTGTQNLAQTWFWNQYDVKFAGGATTGPVSSGWATWGSCCSRTYDVRYSVTAPYAAVNWDQGPLSIDASVRQNDMRAKGQTFNGSAPTNATDLSAASWDPTSADTVNYKISKTSYSVGGNYVFNKDLAAYARISDGYNFSADRLMYGARGALNGSKPTSFNRLRQQEVGLKYRSGGLSLFGTFFAAQTDESNFEATTQKFSTNSYDAKGIELEAGWRSGDFRVTGGVTLTDAKISKSLTASEVGKRPRRQADVVYSVSPSYVVGNLELGAAFIGSGKSYGDDGNTITMPSYMVTNLFASYAIGKNTTVSVSVNNAFNTLAYTEVEGDGHAARALNGRSAKVSLRYDF